MMAPRTGIAAQSWRIVRTAMHFLRGAAIMALAFPLLGPARRRRHIRAWSRQLLDRLSVRLHVHGEPPRAGEGPLMILANHVSWLDIFVIDAVLPVRFVAKSEVRRWPLIGWMAHGAGTLFIRRARRADTARINGLIAEAMRDGDPFAVFPEATTTDGSRVLKFHSSLLQPVLIADGAVRPVAIRFERADGTLCVEAAYDGDKSAWDTLRLIVAQPAVHAHVSFLDPFPAGGRNRREIATAARDAILQDLARERPHSRTGTGGGHRDAAR